MDKNIEIIEDLLEKGYKISEHQINFRKEKNKDILEDKVTLKKENDVKVISSINSKEFFEYIHHFKKAKDKYDNFEFIYINDIEQYEKRIKKEENHMVMKDHHILKISGREFSEEIMTMYLKPSGPNNPRGFAEFWIDLEKNPDFCNVDFKDELEVYDKNKQLIFRGYIKNYESSDKTGFIFSQDMTLRMEHEKISVEFNNMSPADSISIVTQSAGLNFNPHGIPYNTDERDFIIIMPIQNLIINQSFNIANVEFYQKFDTLDDSLIRKSETGRKDALWNGNFPRAKITTRAKEFLEAIKKGHNAISKAVDIISLRTDMSFPSLKIKEVNNIFVFSYYKHLSKVKIPTRVYCREANSQANVFFNTESLKENVLSLEFEPKQYFEDIGLLFSNLISKENPSQEESNILQVIHWLRRAIQEGNKKDKLIDLWTAFEFLISGVKSNELFTKSDKLELKKIISKTYLNSKQRDALDSKIDMLNDSPLLEKFRLLIESLNLSFSQDEFNILKKTRDKRNDLIHGRKDILIEDFELNKLRTIIEKVVIQKVGSQI